MVYQFESSKEGCTPSTGAPSGTAAAPGPSNGLPRPQSSLELLSQTAAVLEHSPVLTYSSSTSLVSVHSGDLNNTTKAASSSNVYSAGGSSPKEARGVTPTESSMSPQKHVPSLPDMSSKHQQQQKKKQPVFLEQKPTSFLPAPLLSDGIPGDSSEGRAGTPLYYSPGLFLTYSNGSTGGGGAGQPQPYHQQAAPPVTTTTTGSEDAVVPNFLTSHGSFTSSGSLASAPSFAFAPTTMTNGAVSLASSSIAPAAAFAPPPTTLQQQQHPQARGSFDNITVTAAEEQQQRENYFLRQQLAAKDTTIDSLQKQVETMQQEIRELRQLPTGKISQIPVEYVWFCATTGILVRWVVCFLSFFGRNK